MSHPASKTLDLYLDYELTAGERMAVETHLESCAECRSRVDNLRTLFVTLHTLQPESIPFDLTSRVLEKVAPRARTRAIAAAILAAQVATAAWLALWLWPSSGDQASRALANIPGTQWQVFAGSSSPASLLAAGQTWLSNTANQGAALLEHIDPLQLWVALVAVAILWLAGNRLLMAPRERNSRKEEAAR